MHDVARDREEILKLHRDWWIANIDVNIPLMITCFPTGMNYLMFNYNWHPYFGLAEKIRLWEYYKAPGLHLEGPPDVRIMKLDLSGDMAYIAAEFEITTAIPKNAKGLIDEQQALPPPGQKLTERGRATEIYKRDDGEGRPIWKMWHFHCSPLPDPNRQRPGFDDTANSRGELGWNPWGEPLRVVGPGID
jgi:hypothetical protein